MIYYSFAKPCAAANPDRSGLGSPAIALLVESSRSRCRLSGLQVWRPAGRVAEPGSLDVMDAHDLRNEMDALFAQFLPWRSHRGSAGFSR